MLLLVLDVCIADHHYELSHACLFFANQWLSQRLKRHPVASLRQQD